MLKTLKDLNRYRLGLQSLQINVLSLCSFIIPYAIELFQRLNLL